MSPALTAYLAEFDAHSHRLSQVARLEVGSRIWTRCAEHAGPEPDGPAREERIREALAELGPPAELVRAELERIGELADPFRARDIAPLHLFAASILTLGVGAAVGLVLLWCSPVWPGLHKIVATALVGVGILAVPLLVPALGGLPGLLVGAVAVGPALAAVHLALARRSVRRLTG